MSKYRVEIREVATDKLVKTIGKAMSLIRAEKVERGIEINLDYEKYYVEIVPEKE